ncbi:MAG: hypothetical protein ACO3HG_06935, partial [Schleiferiaceae bacterium]
VHAAHDVRWPAVARFVQHHPLGRTLKRLRPPSALDAVKRASAASVPLRLSPEARRAAWTYFAEDVQQLEALTGKDLSLWT